MKILLFLQDEIRKFGFDLLTLILFKVCPETSTVLGDAFSKFYSSKLADLFNV